ncbi:MAG: hypothetical protein NVSMB7_03820 [Chitinophagaceae bacterium]
MEIYHQQDHRQVFGKPVKTFPQGIGDAFGALMKMIPDGNKRAYYGLSKMDTDGRVLYWATAEEKFPGEAEKYGCEKLTLPKGDYLAVTVHDWRGNTDCIKDVFHEMMQDKRADITKPCVEWYNNDNEMLCMLQTDPAKELFACVDEATDELMELISALREEQLNTIPFKGSWTAAQLATHVIKSNNAIAQAMDMDEKVAERNPAERVEELKKIFLGFSIRMKSPEFIAPEPGRYEKEKLVAALKRSCEQIKEKRAQLNLSAVIEISAFGQITRLELLHFVLYHTRRHIHQLKNILQHI